MKKLVVAAALALMSTGCYHIKYTTNNPPGGQPQPVIWHHDVAIGLVELAPIDVSKTCPNGFAVVDNQQTVVDAILGYLLRVIWTPNSVTITCAGGGAATPPAATPPAGT